MKRMCQKIEWIYLRSCKKKWEWKILEVLLRGPNQQIRKKTQTKTKKKTIVKTMYPFQSKKTTNEKLTTS